MMALIVLLQSIRLKFMEDLFHASFMNTNLVCLLL